MSSRIASGSSRLAYLDGLRGVAILAVVGFHFFSCFQDLYPYGSLWADWPLFRWGHLGVQLFFAISGFVIAMTLERSTGSLEFAVRRFARLWPTLLLCASISYAVLSVLPSPWTPKPADLLPSLTLLDGAIWNKAWPGLNAQWIDIAYWSLFVEVRFYVLAGLLWALASRRFAVALFGLSTALVMLYAGLHAFGQAQRAEWLQWAFAVKYLPWFVVGVAAREASYDRAARCAVGLLAASVQTAALLALGDAQAKPLALVGVAMLMLAPLRWPRVAAVFGARPLAAIGAFSYSLYLLHQYAGLALTFALARALNLQGLAAIPIALAVITGTIVIARWIHLRYETPLNGWIVAAFTKASNRRTGRQQAQQPATPSSDSAKRLRPAHRHANRSVQKQQSPLLRNGPCV